MCSTKPGDKLTKKTGGLGKRKSNIMKKRREFADCRSKREARSAVDTHGNERTQIPEEMSSPTKKKKMKVIEYLIPDIFDSIKRCRLLWARMGMH